MKLEIKKRPLVIISSTLGAIAGMLIAWETIEDKMIAPWVNSMIYEECRVGIVVEDDGHKHYTHIDCREYQPIIDSTGDYYFIDDEGEAHWCQ